MALILHFKFSVNLENDFKAKCYIDISILRYPRTPYSAWMSVPRSYQTCNNSTVNKNSLLGFKTKNLQCVCFCVKGNSTAHKANERISLFQKTYNSWHIAHCPSVTNLSHDKWKQVLVLYSWLKPLSMFKLSRQYQPTLPSYRSSRSNLPTYRCWAAGSPLELGWRANWIKLVLTSVQVLEWHNL